MTTATRFTTLATFAFAALFLSACDPEASDDFDRFIAEDEQALAGTEVEIALLPAPPEHGAAEPAAPGPEGVAAPAGPEVANEYSVDLSVYKELNHYYYLHLDYYNFYQRIILDFGCSQSSVVFWWEGASQGHTGHANVQRFIDRLDEISNAGDVPASYRNYATSVSNFFGSIQSALDNCTGY